MTPWRALLDLPGVAWRDLPNYRRALASSGGGRRSDPSGWVSLSNRIERVQPDPEGPGVSCDWTWGSALHAPTVWPALGRALLAASVEEWPIRFADAPTAANDGIKVSFVFAHAGAERLPQLRQTIRSIFAQSEVPCECIVVDQTPVPLFAQLPEPVVYRHLAKDGVPAGWHKSWAYNVGARLARGSILVFHDGDICVPADYARELVRAIDTRGYAAASLQRFLFYLRQHDSPSSAATSFQPTATPEMVFQNWKGGTIALAREAYFSIGGFDEGFVDWGGEDDEFFDRCASLQHCRSGYLPFVHLWHAPQKGRYRADNRNSAQLLPARLAVERRARIEQLRTRRFGDPRAPDPMRSY